MTNIAGLLNPALIQNPTAPAANQVNYWQYLFTTGHGGASPAAGNSLLLYTTGHGSAVNLFGGNVIAANRSNGNICSTQIQLAGPDNVQITPGGNITAQISTRGGLTDLASDTFSVDGNSIGGATAATVGSTAFDITPVIDLNPGDPTLDEYDVTIPDSDLTAAEEGESIALTVSSTDDSAILSYDQDIDAVTILDGTPSACADGSCDMYTDMVTPAPEMPTTSMFLTGSAGLLLQLVRRRRRPPSMA
jgi:hypothetical protein